MRPPAADRRRARSAATSRRRSPRPGRSAGAVDRFFVDVLVNADDPGVRARRYALVREAAGVLSRVADFERVTDVGGAR